MMTGAAVVSLIAISGYLLLNWRALQSHGLSTERKLMFAGAWVTIFLIVAFLFSQVGG
jgi:hypothetical protein